MQVIFLFLLSYRQDGEKVSKIMGYSENWIDHLMSINTDVYTRLAECCIRKDDIPTLVNAKWAFYKKMGKDKKGFTKEYALVSILEHLDCNGQYYDLTRDEYIELCR